VRNAWQPFIATIGDFPEIVNFLPEDYESIRSGLYKAAKKLKVRISVHRTHRFALVVSAVGREKQPRHSGRPSSGVSGYGKCA
jgi:hypothetical protein